MQHAMKLKFGTQLTWTHKHISVQFHQCTYKTFFFLDFFVAVDKLKLTKNVIATIGKHSLLYRHLHFFDFVFFLGFAILAGTGATSSSSSSGSSGTAATGFGQVTSAHSGRQNSRILSWRYVCRCRLRPGGGVGAGKAAASSRRRRPAHQRKI